MELLHGKLESCSWITLGFRLDRNLFNIRRQPPLWFAGLLSPQMTRKPSLLLLWRPNFVCQLTFLTMPAFTIKKLSSIPSEDSDINHKIHNRIKQTIAAFVSFRWKVHQNNHLHITIIKDICSSKFDAPYQLWRLGHMQKPHFNVRCVNVLTQGHLPWDVRHALEKEQNAGVAEWRINYLTVC